MVDNILDAAPETGVRFEPGTEAARLTDTLAQVYYRMDADINKIRQSRSVNTAKGRELDAKAREINVTRPEGESDEAFRTRAIAGRTRARSTTTWDDFAEICMAVLDTTKSKVTMEVDYTDELGSVIVYANSDVIEASPFTTTQIVEFLEEGLTMSRRVVLRRRDGFQFDSDSAALGLGWSEGLWTEGVES